ncbi:alpha-1,6-mannosylglycoprotein 6-beta-N-acetylglucosaminyltransferase A-like isoform X2 [Acanthopagrus latus]|uniref:alpha-1,6-mannosylglycoprotein 6-beta-N-acetylglucosaminyltransferase A-like isoform X2 n=1 Tax=Acanthopagrus latus TaxID=8177 RepID=UPI00187C1314|nr:alpha-1,6-mannosylglycoprotein 6-beta-N-acetylglucosaminyltransferase A-like isoform X2 [Acanthopagrus latus]
MRKLAPILRWTLFVLVAISFIWCLTLSFFILGAADKDGISLTHQSRVQRKAWGESSRAEDIMKRIVKFVDDLLNIVGPPGDLSPPPPLKDYKEEFRVLQIQMEAEKDKEKLREKMVEELRSDKVQLQQQVAHLEELLRLQTMKELARDGGQNSEDKNCPLPLMDGYPNCVDKLKWMKEMWRSDPCYGRYGVNGSLCSFLIYLSEMENWCPLLPGRAIPPGVTASSAVGSDTAVVRNNFTGLYPSLENREQFKWVHQRIHSMEQIWVDAGRSLSAKYNLAERKAKQILPSVVDPSGSSSSGVTSSPHFTFWVTIFTFLLQYPTSSSLGIMRTSCPPHSVVTPSLIYTDIVGLRQIQAALQTDWVKYKCMIRVLDSFGTEPDFNHAAWAQQHNLTSYFGGLNLIPMQFNTMFPHTPDNTFLGFVVQHQLSSEERQQLESTKRQNQALVYGKRATFWKDKEAYLDVIHRYLEIHGTVDKSASIPAYVKNHGIVKGSEVQVLLRQSKVFVGLSFPYEGPAALEAIANGCAFLNPRLDPPHSRLNTKFFEEKPTIREVSSQNPYAEAIGEPYVWTVDMQNSTDVERALSVILNQTIEPYLPYEFTCEGMLQRVNTLTEKQDFCNNTETWPPLSALQVVKAEVNTSCKQACQEKGLICEPAFFPHLNSVDNLANYSVYCRSSELSDSRLVFPAYSSSEHCVFQSDPLLFSCVRSEESLIRICPCRDYIKDQIALCKACI